MGVKVLLADDHTLMREGLRALLEQKNNIEIIGEAENGCIAVKLALELLPDVVVMDVVMPDLNGMDATKQIINEYSNIKIIALSMHCDKRFVSGMLIAGAKGYLLKDCAFDELNLAIHTVMSDKIYLSPSIAKVVTDDYVRYLAKLNLDTTSVLSAREHEVIQLIAEGKSTREIGCCLHISTKTVDTHRTQIMKKLNFNNIPDLIKYAVREGLTSL